MTMNKVLLAEDNTGVSRLITKNLKKAGYDVTSYATGNDTLKHLYSENDTLLLLDYMLPDFTADELISTLDERGVKVPFIIVTGQGDERVAVEMMKRGARDYIVKDSHFLKTLPEVVNRIYAEINRERRLKHTEHELEMSKLSHRMMAESISDGVIIIKDKKLSYTNPSMTDISGYSHTELEGMSYLDLLAPFEKKRVTEFIQENSQSDHKSFETGFWIERKNGGFRYVIARISRSDVNGSSFLFISFTDITKEKLSAKALKDSEYRYRMIFERTPLAIITTSDTGSILTFNSTAKGLFGYSDERLLDMNITKLLPEIHRNMVSDESDSHDSEKSKTIETTAVLAGGKQISIEVSRASWSSNLGDIKAYVLNDITARKQYERYLLSFLEMKKVIFEEHDTPVAINKALEIVGKVTNTDRVYIFKHEYISDDVYASQVYEWCRNPNKAVIDREELQSIPLEKGGFGRWKDAFENGKYIKGLMKDFPEGEREMLKPQEILSIIVLPIIVNRKVWGFVGFDDCESEREWSDQEESMLESLAHTISVRIERDKALDSINISRRLLETTIDSIDDAVLVLSDDMLSNYVNSRFFSIFGCNGQKSRTLEPLAIIEKMVENGEHFTSEMMNISNTKESIRQTFRLNNGRYIDLFTCPLVPEEPNFRRLWTFKDVTSRVRQERAKREFINSVAHELRNPLVLIQGYTELLRDKTPDGTSDSEMLDIISDAVKREIRQIADFVDVGRTNPEYYFVRMNAFKLFSQIGAREQVFIKKRVTSTYGDTPYSYSFDLDENTKCAEINIDPDRIDEIVNNLLINSIKYSKPDSIDITFKVSLEGDSIVIIISDKGIGIPEDDIGKVLKPFYQVDRGEQLKTGGLGLGLSNVLLHVNSHGGNIDINSREGIGTSVTIKIPVVEKHEQA